MTPEEKKTYDSLMKVMNEAKNKDQLVDNATTNNSTEEDGKEDMKGVAIAMVEMDEKTLEVKKTLLQELVFKDKQK